MKKYLAVVPMRAGSTGLPGKHMRQFGQQTVAIKTIRQVLDEIGGECDVLVSTDSDDIAEHCSHQGALIHRRGHELSNSTASTEAVLKVIAEEYADSYQEAIYLSACELSRWDGALSELVDSHTAGVHDSTFFVECIAKKIWTENNGEVKILRQCSGDYLPRQTQKKDNLLIEHTGLGLITQFKYWLKGNRYGGKINVLPVSDSYRHIDLYEEIDLKLGQAYWKLA